MTREDIIPARLEVTRDDNDVLVSAVLKLGGRFSFPFKWVAWDVQLDNFAHLELKHGEWIDTGEAIGDDIEVKCSLCGEELYWLANFCPNCGARMKGDEK